MEDKQKKNQNEELESMQSDPKTQFSNEDQSEQMRDVGEAGGEAEGLGEYEEGYFEAVGMEEDMWDESNDETTARDSSLNQDDDLKKAA